MKVLKPTYYATEHLPHGWMAATSSDQGVTKLSPPCPSEELALAAIKLGRCMPKRQNSQFIHLFNELSLYLDAKTKQLSSPIDISDGPLFFQRVWAMCRTIPYGETRSYGWLASASGNPQAQRAVGQAMANNPIPLLVPCHRILKANGQLGGYAWGVPLKSRLLSMESTQPN